ncbi:MAG: hypothetical protein GY789_28230 [Hyphomicrobiales bacterium]|nr:hypothetical protein [Hyphomicrobiales bacterium]MCP5000162.1 hypothetical protein [Hyphomicrobiales bacterium]
MKTKWIVAEGLLAIVVLLVWYFAVYSRTYPEIEILRWLDKADAKAVFQQDLESGRIRFFVLNGSSSAIPGIEPSKYNRCYSDVQLRTIKGTSDMFLNEEHLRLTMRADTFAKSYNLLMSEQLDRQKGGDCLPE